MNELVYLYQPRGYFPGYCYRRFEDAVAQLLEDNDVATLEELVASLPEGWWYEFTDHSIAIDDGERITEIELR